MKSKISFLLSIIALIFISGCTQGGLNPEVLVKANSQVESFLEDNPNADLNLLYYSENASVELEEEYLMTCDRELTPKNLYRFSIVDNSTGLNILGYLDVENQVVDCLKRDSTFVEQNTQEDSNNENSNLGNNTEFMNSTYETKKEIELDGLELSQTSYDLINDIESYLSDYNNEVEFELEIEVNDNNQAIFEEESDGTLSSELTDLFASLVSSVNNDINNLTLNSDDELSIEIKRSLRHDDDEESDDSNEEDNNTELMNSTYETQVDIESDELNLSNQSLNLINDIENALNNYSSELELSYEAEYEDNQLEDNIETNGNITEDISSLWDELLISIENDISSFNLSEDFEFEVEIERKVSD